MATIELNAYLAQRSQDGSVQVVFRAGPPPYPSRRSEVKNTAAALEALAAYKTEAAAAGQPMAVTMRVVAGRTPNGFKAATSQHYYPINV